MYETPQLRRLVHDREVTARRVVLGDADVGASPVRALNGETPNAVLVADDTASTQQTI